MSTSTYDAKDIHSLGDLEAIRMRPGMYIGDTSNPQQLFIEALDNAIDEVQSGYSEKAVVIIDTKENLYAVRDYGRGIPHGKSQYKDLLGNDVEIETLQLVFTKNHSGGKFGGEVYKKSRGLHGIGLKAINSLSTHARAITFRKGKYVELDMSRGEILDLQYGKVKNVPLHDKGEDTDNNVRGTDLSDLPIDTVAKVVSWDDGHDGTYVEFIPDPEIFEDKVIPLNSILTLSGISKAFGSNVEVYVDGELQELPYNNLFDLLPKSSDHENEFFTTSFHVDSPSTESIDIALRYTSDTNTLSRGYTNTIYNSSGGSHIRFFESCYKEAWQKFMKKDCGFKPEDTLVGLRAVVGVFINNDQMAFAGQTKERLTTRINYFEQFRPKLVRSIRKYFNDNPTILKGLIKRFTEYRTNLEKMRASKELEETIYVSDSDDNGRVRRKSVVEKLRECSSKSREGTRLFICFTGDTKVKLLNGTSPTFEELVDMEKETPGRDYWLYSVDENNHIVPGRGFNPRITGETTELVHVILDDGTEIKCTPNHPFMLRDGEYIEAKDLTEDTSLRACYFKYDGSTSRHGDEAYEFFYDPIKGNWDKTHTHVAEYLFGKPEFPPNGSYGDRWDCHHVDMDPRNNDPSNLIWLTKREHGAFHFVVYNKSEEHRKKASEIGRKYGSEIITRYNKSEAHRKAASKVGKVTGPIYITEYNKSEGHRNTVANMNANDDVKRLQWRGKVLKVAEMMYDQGIPFTSENYNSARVIKNPNKPNGGKGSAINLAPRYENLLRYFDSYDELMEKVKLRNHKVSRVWTEHLDKPIKVYDLTVDEHHNFLLRCDTDSGVIVHNCEGDSSSGSILQARNVKYDAVLPIRGKILNVSNKTPNESMKNEEVRSIVNAAGTGMLGDCNAGRSRYDQYLFAVDADEDGNNIAALLTSIFVNLLPDLVRKGMVYVVVPPLYSWNDHGRTRYTSNLDDIKDKSRMTRFKGLGEMSPEDIKDTFLSPDNQVLVQLQYPNDLEQFNEAMTSASMRFDMLKAMGLIVRK